MGLFTRRNDDNYQTRGDQYNNGFNSNNSNLDNNYNSNNSTLGTQNNSNNLVRDHHHSTTAAGTGVMGHGRNNDYNNEYNNNNNVNNNSGTGFLGRHDDHNDGYNNNTDTGIPGHHNRSSRQYGNSGTGITGRHNHRNDEHNNSGITEHDRNRNDGLRNSGIAGHNTNGNNGYYNGTEMMGNNNHYGRHGDGYNNGIGTNGRDQHREKQGFMQRHKQKKREKNREKRALFDIDSGYYNRRPSFGQWIKFTWIDIITMVILGAIGLGVYKAHPAPTRSFPIAYVDGNIVYPEFAYPIRHEIIPIWAAALLGSLVPIFIILCMQVRIRSFWDVNNAIIGLLYSLITAAVFQVFLKWLIGGLRPHFLEACDPDPQIVALGGSGYNGLMFTSEVCRGSRDGIDDSLESFPSGHSTAAFAGFMFLYFYLNAKLKVFSNHHPAMWKLVALYTPVLAAVLIAGTLTIDEYHNWYDCLAGAIIGSIMAISAYRMTYASVWDFRFNHIPLTRHTPFSYGAGEAGAGGFESTVFTRKAGWGFEEAYGGAPFDAAHGLRGQLTGFNQGAPGRHGGAGLLGNKRDDDVEHNAVGNTTGHNHGHKHGHDRNNLDNNTSYENDRNHNLNTNNKTHHSGKGGGVLGGIMGGHKNHDNQQTVTSTNTATNTRNDVGGVTANRDSTGNYVNEPNTNRNSLHHVNEPISNRGNIYSDSNQPTSQALASSRDNNFNEPANLTREGRYSQHSRSLERKAIPQQTNTGNSTVTGNQNY